MNILRRIALKIIKMTNPAWPDELYIKVVYFVKFKKWLDLDNPKSFNEKLQWLKLNYHNPDFHDLVDKVKVKDYVRRIIGDEYVIPTLGVWRTVEEVDFSALPDQFVIKCNHNSGTGLYICKDKSAMDETSVRNNLKKGLREDYFLNGREWPYKYLDRMILAEELLVNNDPNDKEIHDYKLYCFDGFVEYVMVSNDRSKGAVKFDYFDRDFNHLPLSQGGENYAGKIARPENLDLMISLAEKLSQKIPHVRVDFYNVNGRVYFGELTFFDSSGFAKFSPDKWDMIWGEKLNLPEKML